MTTLIIAIILLFVLKYLVIKNDLSFVREDGGGLSKKISIAITFSFIYLFILYKTSPESLLIHKENMDLVFEILFSFIVASGLYLVFNLFLTAMAKYQVFFLKSIVRIFIKVYVFLLLLGYLFMAGFTIFNDLKP